jgi:hypothetical protein
MKRKKDQLPIALLSLIGFFVLLTLVLMTLWLRSLSLIEYDSTAFASSEEGKRFAPPTLDIEAYDAKMRFLAHLPPMTASTTATSTATSTEQFASTTPDGRWPANAPRPEYGAIIPEHRIVAYYGNFYSTAMGILGENDASTTKTKLMAEVARWRKADPKTPVMPAVHYIALTAQASPGFDGKYRARMPWTEIDKAIKMAREIHGVVFLDLQVGLSDVETEVPLIERYLKEPDVHLALDPEFDMYGGKRPGTVIGTMDAKDINWAIDYLSDLTERYDLPPKILVIHRFTEDMVTNYARISPTSKVQVVMDMDGWGTPEKKFGTYNRVIADEPVQFTGFKLFYKNDLRKPSPRLLAPEEVISLTPSPIYIQYQ